MNITHTKLYVRIPLFDHLLGDPIRKTILDAGCGDGSFTKRAKEKGALRVVGVDRNGTVLPATTEEGIKYVTASMETMNLAEEFDIITTIYSLNYAKTQNDLTKICTNLCRHTKVDGHIIGIVPHEKLKPNNNFMYGRRIRSPLEKAAFDDADTVYTDIKTRFTFSSLTFYYWKQETYTTALQQAGFQTIQWHEPTVSPTGLKRLGKEYWSNFINNPTMIGFTAAR